MSFRIRNTDTETEEEYQATQNAYLKHLETFKKSSNQDLWKFFANDFFHDGTIESIEVLPNIRTVALHLDCPNIRSYDEKGEFKYVSVDFVCTFQNVIHFSIKDSCPTEASDYSGQPSSFLYSEINTAIPDNLPGDKDEFFSLVIETFDAQSQSWIELVFSQVDVVPKEPAAFAIMEDSQQFHVPTYHPDT